MSKTIIKCPFENCNEELEIGLSIGMKYGLLDKGVGKCPYCNRHFTIIFKDNLITLETEASEEEIKARNIFESIFNPPKNNDLTLFNMPEETEKNEKVDKNEETKPDEKVSNPKI